MVEKYTKNPTTEIFHQSIPWVVLVIIFASGFASYAFYSNYSESDSVAHLVWANIFLLVTIIFLKPIVEWRRIAIDDESITIFKMFLKPIKLDISESLYQVVMNKEDIRSFRFRVGTYYTQVSPAIYRNGNRLSKRLYNHITQNRLNVEIAD